MAITIGDNYIGSDNANMIFYTNNSTEVARVNSTSGRQFNSPSFYASCTYDAWRYWGQMSGANVWRNTDAWGVDGYWSVTQRAQGSYGFNTTYGRYYAPVSGYYVFGQTYYAYSDSNAYNYMHINFNKNNGTSYNGGGRHGHSIFGHPDHSSHQAGINHESVIYCSQGEFVNPAPYLGTGNGTGRIYMGHFHFYGHLCP
jgi:hypothetical protein